MFMDAEVYTSQDDNHAQDRDPAAKTRYTSEQRVAQRQHPSTTLLQRFKKGYAKLSNTRPGLLDPVARSSTTYTGL